MSTTSTKAPPLVKAEVVRVLQERSIEFKERGCVFDVCTSSLWERGCVFDVCLSSLWERGCVFTFS